MIRLLELFRTSAILIVVVWGRYKVIYTLGRPLTMLTE